MSVQILTKPRHKVKAEKKKCNSHNQLTISPVSTSTIASLRDGEIILPLSTGIHGSFLLFLTLKSFGISRFKWELEESTDFLKHGNSKMVQFFLLDVVTQVINVIDNGMR